VTYDLTYCGWHYIKVAPNDIVWLLEYLITDEHGEEDLSIRGRSITRSVY